MLRDPNLIPLSHQHHNGLAMCVLTRRSLREDASPANVARLARRAIDRYELELVNHFEIEEQILFPAIEKALGKLSLVASLVAEHRQVEDLIAQLRTAPHEALLERLCGLSGAKRATSSRWPNRACPNQFSGNWARPSMPKSYGFVFENSAQVKSSTHGPLLTICTNRKQGQSRCLPC
jgi:hypothetical protein